VPSPPTETRVPLPVERREDQAAEHRQVLRELQLLGLLGRGVGGLPEPVTAERRRDQRPGQHQRREPRQLAQHQQGAGSDVNSAVDPDELLVVVRQEARRLPCLVRDRRGELCARGRVAKRVHAPADEHGTKR
jgi:hypothetical protein